MNDHFQDYLVEYPYQGARWSLLIKASSWQDAEERLKQMGAFGRVIGSDVTVIPASFGFFAKLLVWWRNLARQP